MQALAGSFLCLMPKRIPPIPPVPNISRILWAISFLMTCLFRMIKSILCCNTLVFMQLRVNKSHLLDLPVAEKQLLSICCFVSTTLIPVPFSLMGTVQKTLRALNFEHSLAWCCRIRGSLREPYGRIFDMANLTPRIKRLKMHADRHRRMSSSFSCLKDMTLRSGKAEGRFPRANSSFCVFPASCSPILLFSFWMKLPQVLIHEPKNWYRQPLIP